MPPKPLSYEELFKMNRFYMSAYYAETQCDEFARRRG